MQNPLRCEFLCINDAEKKQKDYFPASLSPCSCRAYKRSANDKGNLSCFSFSWSRIGVKLGKIVVGTCFWRTVASGNFRRMKIFKLNSSQSQTEVQTFEHKSNSFQRLYQLSSPFNRQASNCWRKQASNLLDSITPPRLKNQYFMNPRSLSHIAKVHGFFSLQFFRKLQLPLSQFVPKTKNSQGPTENPDRNPEIHPVNPSWKSSLT
jgi:hypothetical protein